MSKAIKGMVTDEIKSRYAGVNSACVVDVTGLNVHQQEDLRGKLREASARLEVVKNSLARRAFADGPLAVLGSSLQGPCAIVTSKASLIDAAKALVSAASEYEALTLKQALIEGDPDLITVADLAKMKSLTELIGEVVGLLTSPGRFVVGAITAPLSRIAGCLDTLAEGKAA